MSFVLYVVVLVVSVTSVMMGLDWLSTPPPPVPKSVQTVSAPAKPVAPANKVAATATASKQTASTTGTASAPAVVKPAVAKAAPPKSTPAKSEVADTTIQSPATQPDMTATVSETAGSAPNDALAKVADSKTDAMANAGDVTGATADAAAPRCDVQACAAHYRSFNPADCTYQPYNGPRRLCMVGNPPAQANDATTGMQTSDASQPPASSSCNYDACAAAYRSFDPATCTYQPYEGPRRACEK